MSEGTPFSRTTFHRHRIAIEEIFGLYIECDKKRGNKYYIGNASVLEEDTIQNWMLSTLSVGNMLSESRSLHHRILLENVPSGGEMLQTVIKAMKEGHCENASEHIDEILQECVDFSGYDINIRPEDVQNRFDVTCQGTVPVALWVIGQSNGFEDSVRRAVALGADADTLGAIVGSMAEAIWGIPETIRLSALSFLDEEMKKVLSGWERSKRIKENVR